MSTHLAPLPIPPLDPLVQRIRRVVYDHDELSAAFLYLRGTDGDALHPAVGLMARLDLATTDAAVTAIIEATGTIYDERPSIVSPTPELDVLDAVLERPSRPAAGAGPAADSTSRSAPRATSEASGPSPLPSPWSTRSAPGRSRPSPAGPWSGACPTTSTW